LIFEKGTGWRGSLASFRQEINPNRIGLGFTGFIFATTGPLVILVASANKVNLPLETTISWIFIIYVTSGLGSIGLSLYYRQPIVVAFSIPGIALSIAALTHYSFSDVVGAYFVIGILLFLMGITGVAKWVMSWVPLPVLMGMVAAVLLPYGISVFKAVDTIPEIAFPSIGIFLVLMAFPRLARYFPPVICALVVALFLATLTNATNWGVLQVGFSQPIFFAPTFNLNTILDLAPPLLVSVVAVQNGQGIGVMLGQGYKPPVNTMTAYTGLGSIVNAFFGGHSACIAGPVTAIVGGPSAGPKEGRYAAAVANGVFWVMLGLVAPVVASLDKVVLSPSLILMLGGLAMLPVLLGTFSQAFGGKFRFGALFALLITLSEVKIAGIGSAFWGLLGGMLATMLLDRADFMEMVKHNRSSKEG